MSSGIEVVITGLGATTPLGGDVTSTWDALLAGKSGVAPMTHEWVAKYDLPVKIASELVVDPTEVLPEWKLDAWTAPSRSPSWRPARHGPTRDTTTTPSTSSASP